MLHCCLSEPCSPYPCTQSTLSPAKEKGRGQGKGTELGNLGTVSPSTGASPWGKRGRIFLAENQVPRQREGRQKPSGKSQPLHALGLGTRGTFMPQGTQVASLGGETEEPREGEQPFRSWSLSHVWRRHLPPAAGAGREGDDRHRAWPQHLPSHSFPSPLRGQDQHKPEQPPSVRKGFRAADDSGTSTSKLG